MALRLDRAGADGLVLFNRFLQPGHRPGTLTITTGFGLSSPAEGTAAPGLDRAAWPAGSRASLAASTGVDGAADVAAYLLAGADVVMTTSALLRHGPEHAMVLLGGLTDWLTQKGFMPPGRRARPAGQFRLGRRRPGTGRVRQVAAGRRPRRALAVTPPLSRTWAR